MRASAARILWPSVSLFWLSRSLSALPRVSLGGDSESGNEMGTIFALPRALLVVHLGGESSLIKLFVLRETFSSQRLEMTPLALKVIIRCHSLT